MWLVSGFRARMWCKGSKSMYQPTVKHSAKVNIWLRFLHLTHSLCVFTQNLDSHFFVKILKWHLLENAKVFHGTKWFLIQDNHPKHTSRRCKVWMTENVPNNQLDWTSQSPDINPIENLFGWMKYKLNRDRPKTIKDLKARLGDIWDSITPEILEPYYSSMTRRCQMVVENNGYKINKRASLACAARLADTLYPPEAPFGRLGSHWLIIREITSLIMSILVLKSISLEKSSNFKILKFLKSNDDVITK